MPGPEFTRVAWASEQAQAVWAPRVDAIREAWLDVELRTVAEGVRPAAIVFDRPGLHDRLRSFGMHGAPLEQQRFAVARSTTTAQELAAAWRRRDDPTVGQCLDYPECCVRFFDHVWNGRQRRDTTLDMAQRSPTPVGSNILGRWLGVRLVFHLPCAFGCYPSEMHAQLYRAFLPRDCAAWAHELLSWPVQYSALHGIAEVVWPVVKVITSTDYTPTREERRLTGTSYPTEAPHGLKFPFRKPAFVPLTSLANFTTSVHSAIRGDAYWRDNGFATLDAMEAAHAQILRALDAAPPRGPVLDLGCGNGALLERIAARFDVAVSGIERDATKRSAIPVVVRDLRDWSGDAVDTILVSQRRFEEVPGLEARAMESARQVLVYSYDAPQSFEVRGGHVHTSA